ncbi:DUF190 domain-containing protein [Nocardia sp. NPDC051463]|uniref:DUF190 domain-containing protein n=1 Tax=Nocardia sp. NPDC051463 TaxID=3154845 RepID=UPI003443E4B7
MNDSPAGARPTAGQWKRAARLTVLLDEDDKWKHGPLYHEIVQRARDAGLAGASVWRGVEGYGASSRIHTSRILDLAEHLPVQVMVIDDAQRLRSFVEQNAEMLAAVNVTLSDVTIWQPGAGMLG